MINFYDTSALLATNNNNYEEPFIISSVTLDELNNLKDNKTKTPEIRSKARQVLNWLDNNEDKYQVVLFTNYMLAPIRPYDFEITNDMKILACAMNLGKSKEITFWCNDTGFRKIAQEFNYFISIQKAIDKREDYKGYLETSLTNDQLNTLYSDLNTNSLNLLTNQYLIVRDDETGQVTDKLCWDGKRYRRISYSNFSSKWFDEVAPIQGDIYQQLAFDALLHSQVTMLSGPAGVGKTAISLAYIMQEIEQHRIDKVIIFANPVAARNAARIGYLPGSASEKMLDSSIGNILGSKLGGKDEVMRLIDIKKLELCNFSDLRGFDTTRYNAIVYITEAENLDSELMKLALTRVGENNHIILDGDYRQQTDLDIYESDNGMRKVIDVFKGDSSFAMVDLPIVHRSHIADLAQKI